MKNDQRLMNEVFRIVSGALRLDVDKVRNYTAFLADKLEQGGDVASASRLRKMLVESDHHLRPATVSSPRLLPVDGESRFPLLEKVNLQATNDSPIVLSPMKMDVVAEFLSVARSHAQLEAAGIFGSMSLLLYGPPGTGKSHLARHIARELGLDLYIARLDGLISSYLGSTSKNIRAIFEFASRTPCILFLDEFDAVAKLRGDAQELGELKRVVNSFIQNLDSLGSQTVVIAATNHPELLDRAVWRRFIYRLEMDYPTAAERQVMWAELLRDLAIDDRDVALLTDVSEGFSGSDIREVSVRLHRRRMTQGGETGIAEAFRALLNLAPGEGGERRFLVTLVNAAPEHITEVLRKRDPRLYSHANLARLLGVSKSTAYRLSSGGEQDE